MGTHRYTPDSAWNKYLKSHMLGFAINILFKGDNSNSISKQRRVTILTCDTPFGHDTFPLNIIKKSKTIFLYVV